LRDNSTKEKSVLNRHIQCRRLSILFLISITLVFSSSLYLLPLSYSQEFSYSLSWRDTGRRDAILLRPEGIAVDSSSGNVYVADTANNRIQVFSSNGTFISRFGKYGNENGTLRSPAGIAVDSSSGNVYVADTANNRIQVFSSNGTFISEWGEHGGGPGSFREPQGIALDQAGNVYVADTANHRIQVFSSNGTFMARWGGYGDHDDMLSSPEGIAVDSSSGNVYVADTANNHISVFTSRSPISNVAFSSKDGETYGNDTRIKIETIYDGLKFPTAIAFLGFTKGS
jgi:DNA-binding beta-propeller fold protein YncE